MKKMTNLVDSWLELSDENQVEIFETLGYNPSDKSRWNI